jgi:hypothetical protein
MARGDQTNIVQVMNLDEETRQRLLKVEQALGATSAAQGGFGDLTPLGPWPTATRPAKNGRITVTLRTAIPSTTNRFKIVLEQYTGSGSPVTVVDQIASADIEVNDDQRVAGQGDFIFPVPLSFNAQYGCIKLVSIDADGNRVVNPDPDWPDSPRNETDYLITFVTAATAANAPSKPTTARVVGNSVDSTADGVVGSVTLRIYADETQTKTFAAQLTDSVQPKLVKASDSSIVKRVFNIDDNTQTSIDCQIGDLQIGREYDWTKNTAFSSGDGADAVATSTVAIFAGGYADPSDALANLTQVSFTGTTQPDGSILLTITLHQPTPPYRLKNGYVERKLSSEGTGVFDGNIVVDQFPLQDPVYNTAGNVVLTLGPVPAKASRTYNFRLTVKAIGNVTKQFTSGDLSSGALATSAALTAAGGGPSLIVGGSLQASLKNYDDKFNPPGAAGDAIYPLLRWETVSNSGVKIDNKAVGGGGSADAKGVRWDSANARLEIETNIVTLGGAPAARVGKLFHKNDVVSLCPSFLSATASITPTISFAIVDQVAGDIVVATATSFPISNTTAGRGLWILVVPNSYAGTAKQWIEMRVSANPAQKFYVWNLQLDWGEVYRDFKVNGDEQQVLDFLDVSPINTSISGSGLITESADGTQYSRSGTVAGPISLS